MTLHTRRKTDIAAILSAEIARVQRLVPHYRKLASVFSIVHIEASVRYAEEALDNVNTARMGIALNELRKIK